MPHLGIDVANRQRCHEQRHLRLAMVAFRVIGAGILFWLTSLFIPSVKSNESRQADDCAGRLVRTCL
jgi:hypothetical protein